LNRLDIAIVAHNSFFSVLVELGILGFLVFFLLVVSLFYSALSLPVAERCLWVILLLVWCIGVSSLTWEYRKPTWFLFALLTAQSGLQLATRREIWLDKPALELLPKRMQSGEVVR
jgi:O-antigen ligase